MKKLLLIATFILLATVRANAQGMTLENYAGGTNGATPTVATLNASWYGGRGAGSTANVVNPDSVLTYSNPLCGGTLPPRVPAGSLALTYSTGTGTQSAPDYITLAPPGTQPVGDAWMTTWFCSDYLASDSVTSNIDLIDVFMTGTASNPPPTLNAVNIILSCGGGLCEFQLEPSNGCGATCATNGSPVPYTPNTWVQLAEYYPGNATCARSDHADCLRAQVYNASGALIGQWYENPFTNATLAYFFEGDALHNPKAPNRHIWFMYNKMCYIGCSAAQFPTLENPAPAWDGILTPGRGVDWTQAGFNGGVPPDASWTQCSSTLTAGTYTGASITATLAGCAANTFYLLGFGTFNISGQVNYPNPGNVVVRGSGANNTFVVGTSGVQCAGQISAVFCMDSSDHTYTQGPGTPYNWTAGYAQGSNQITLSSVAGISISTPTLLMLDQCDTGYTGSTCAGTATDNTNAYICGDLYHSVGPVGCSMDGPDSGGSRIERDQLEMHVATAINGSVVTVSPPLQMPNWASGLTPQVWRVTPIVHVGIEDMSIDVSPSGAPTGCIDVLSAWQFWITRVRCTNNKRAAVNVFQSANGLILSNYIFNSTGTLPSNYGLRLSATANLATCNNIIQSISGGSIFYDGAAIGDVDCANFIINSQAAGFGDLVPTTEHAGDYFVLHDENAVPQISCDNIHGTCDFSVRDRNFLTGWTSYPSVPVGTFTQGIADFAFARYIANFGNVLGTPGYHNTYTSVNSNTAIYNAGTGGGSTSVPTDSLTKSTTLYWASYDTVTGGNRFCGNSLDTGWSTTCSSTSEAPDGASTYPNFVPVRGDTAIGEPPLPASLYLSSQPSWWGSTPWPAIGPDVTGGNVGQCSGSLNVIGQFDGMPALSNAQCGGHGFTAGAWGGHVYAIPAMACALNTMGMPPDGSGGALTFNPTACYAGGGGGGSVTLTPASLNCGTVTQFAFGTCGSAILANSSGSTITLSTPTFSGANGADFSVTTTTCGATLTTGNSCSYTDQFNPQAPPTTNEVGIMSIVYTGASGSPAQLSLSGLVGGLTVPPAAMNLLVDYIR